MKSPITTHVLDTALGKPAGGVPVKLEEFQYGASWGQVGSGVTNSDGRVENLLPAGNPAMPGIYRLTFDLKTYYQGKPSFYPYVSITFEIKDTSQHYHVPLLVSGFGFSTYRGS